MLNIESGRTVLFPLRLLYPDLFPHPPSLFSPPPLFLLPYILVILLKDKGVKKQTRNNQHILVKSLLCVRLFSVPQITMIFARLEITWDLEGVK